MNKLLLEQIEWQENYPMDFYANASLGHWTVNNERNRQIPDSRRKKNLHTEKLSAENAPSNLKGKEGCDGQTRSEERSVMGNAIKRSYLSYKMI